MYKFQPIPEIPDLGRREDRPLQGIATDSATSAKLGAFDVKDNESVVAEGPGQDIAPRN